MAVDTPEKRRMALDFGKIRGTGMPIPMGIIPASSRAHVLNLYYFTSVIPPTVYFWRNKNLLSGVWSSKQTPQTNWTGKASPSTQWSEKVTPQDGTTQEI